MAETAITTVLAKVAELVAWEAAVLLEVGDDVRLLRDKLEWLHTFIRDADRRRRLRDDEFVAVWVRQTRDVAFEAEDAVDDFLHRAGRRRRKPALGSGCTVGGWWWWPGPGGCAGQVALRHDLSGRIRQIRKRLDEISENRAVYHIEHTPAPAWAASSSATSLAAWYEAGRSGGVHGWAGQVQRHAQGAAPGRLRPRARARGHRRREQHWQDDARAEGVPEPRGPQPLRDPHVDGALAQVPRRRRPPRHPRADDLPAAAGPVRVQAGRGRRLRRRQSLRTGKGHQQPAAQEHGGEAVPRGRRRQRRRHGLEQPASLPPRRGQRQQGAPDHGQGRAGGGRPRWPHVRPDRADPAEPGEHLRGVPSPRVRAPRRLPRPVQVEVLPGRVPDHARPAAVDRRPRGDPAVQGAAGGVGRGDGAAGPAGARAAVQGRRRRRQRQQQQLAPDHVAGLRRPAAPPQVVLPVPGGDAGEHAGGRAAPGAPVGGGGVRAPAPREHHGGGRAGVPQGAHLPVHGAAGAQGRLRRRAQGGGARPPARLRAGGGAGGQLHREPRQHRRARAGHRAPPRRPQLHHGQVRAAQQRAPQAALHHLRLRGGSPSQVVQQLDPHQRPGLPPCFQVPPCHRHPGTRAQEAPKRDRLHDPYQIPWSPLRRPGEAPEHHRQPCQPAVAHPRRPARPGGARRVLEDPHAAARRRAVRSAQQGPGRPAQPPDAPRRASPRVGRRRLQPAGEGRQPPVAGAPRADRRARRCARGRAGEPRPPGAPGAAGRPAAVERVQCPEPPPAAEPEADRRHGCAGGAQRRGGRPVHPAQPDHAVDVEHRGGAEVRGHAGRAAEPGRADDDVRLLRRRPAGVRGGWVSEAAQAEARPTEAGGVDGEPGVHAGARHADAVPVRQNADAPGGARRDDGAGGGGAVQHARHRGQDQGGRRPGLPQGQARTRHPDYILIINIW